MPALFVEHNAEKETDKNLLAAYRLFKDLTWDFPESQWAKYARGRLAGEQLEFENGQFVPIDSEATP